MPDGSFRVLSDDCVSIASEAKRFAVDYINQFSRYSAVIDKIS